MIAPQRARRGRDRRAQSPRCASPPSAEPTCAPSSPPGRVGARRLLELAERFGPRSCCRPSARSSTTRERRTRACIAAARGRRAPIARDVLEAREGDLEIALKATVDGDRITLDFTGSAPQHEGNLNCPLAVTRSACYFAIRVLTDPDIPPNAGAYRPVEVIAPEGSPAERALAGGGGRRQRRDLLARGRRRAARIRPRARPGDDEQRDARQRGRRLLRDDRRRPGRLPGRRRPERRARRDEQHAEHADRGTRARVPDAHDRVLRLRRGSGGAGRVRRRRRRDPRARGARAAAATR